MVPGRRGPGGTDARSRAHPLVDVFGLRQRLVDDYADFTRSFVVIRDEQIRTRVDEELDAGLLWPHPIVQLNPAFEPGGMIRASAGAAR